MRRDVIGTKPPNVVELSEAARTLVISDVLERLVILPFHEGNHAQMNTVILQHPVQMEQRICNIARDVLQYVRMDDEIVLKRWLIVQAAQIHFHTICKSVAGWIEVRANVGSDLIHFHKGIVQASLWRKVQNLGVFGEHYVLQVEPDQARTLQRATLRTSDILSSVHVDKICRSADVALH
ncbi:hypothetical protein GCM10027564_10850 [Luteimonas notoginsengisoli]